jgi:acyl-CoA synthetase (NDP forming)
MNMVNLASHNKSFWHSLFAADSVAVIGARDVPGTWAFDAMNSVLAPTKMGIRRRVYAVNPSTQTVMGLSSYKTILDIADPVELAIIVVPANVVPSVLRQCAQKKVKAAVIISAGFAEVDEAGARLQAELVQIARQGGLHFVGPNCIGHADLHSQVASTRIAGRIRPGTMALLSQSGTLGATIAQMVASNGIGLSKFVATGNEADLHLEDYLEYLAQDNDTRLITAYIEGLREGRRFFQLAQEITVKKPIVVIKTGTTNESGRAAKSHTGALAGSDAIYTAAFKQAGVIRAEDEEDLCGMAVALLNQPLPRGNRIGILTFGGGFGVMAAEACEKEGLKIATLEPKTLEKLNAILPSRWSHGNPVDIAGVRGTAEDTTFLSCQSLLLADKNIDAILSFLPPIVSPPQPDGSFSPDQIKIMQADNQKQLDLVSQQLKQYDKPLYLVRMFMLQPAKDASLVSPVIKERIPEYGHVRRAARVLCQLAWYQQYLNHRRACSRHAVLPSF